MAKSMEEIRALILRREYSDLMLLNAHSHLVRVEAMDLASPEAPRRYRITYTCKGLCAAGKIAERFIVSMTLRANYPDTLPDFVVDVETPIYHPNVSNDSQGRQFISVPSVFPPQLRDYVLAVGELIQWKRQPLWSEEPVIDDRPLCSTPQLDSSDDDDDGIVIEVMSANGSPPLSTRPVPPPPPVRQTKD